ncbi:hypothetical protein QS257_08120 [Terrilactibacillus sp. S3-3]|nr:hypothetical protein QS257_08120 [Terrilactibacillus sp. S3-3]
MNGKGRMSMNRIEEIRRRHRERKAFGTASKHLREKKMGDFSSPYSTYDERDSEIHGLHRFSGRDNSSLNVSLPALLFFLCT